MPPADGASSSSGQVSVLDVVRTALSNVAVFMPKADENKLMALKGEAANLRKPKKIECQGLKEGEAQEGTHYCQRQ